MEITIKGEAKEIAGLILEIQGRLENEAERKRAIDYFKNWSKSTNVKKSAEMAEERSTPCEKT